MKRRALAAFTLNCLLLITVTAQSTQKAPISSQAITIPFELVNRHVILKVSVNNSRPLSFILDTGDRYSIIDLERARELGLTLQGEVRVGGAGAERLSGAQVKDATFTIQGFAGFSQPVMLALPIRGLAPRMGQDFDGIIGTEFIKRFVVELDYQARVIRLHDKERFAYAGSGETIPIQLNGAGHPILEAEVTPVGSAPVKGKFLLDIGSGGALILHSPFVSEHHLLDLNPKTIKSLGGAGAGGATIGRLGRVAELKIGSFRIKSPITMFSEDKAGALANTELIGNIGQQVMSKFKIFFDYGHDRIILEPNQTFDAPFDRAFSGLSLQAEGPDYRTFRIKEVLENSPGAEAGLRQEDIITAVDGKPATEFTLTKLIEMFERPTPYKLTVRRDKETLHVTLTPRRMV